MELNSLYLGVAKRTQLAFNIIDSFILTEMPPLGVFLESLSFLSTTKHQKALRDCQLEGVNANLTILSQDYSILRRKSVNFRIFTVTPNFQEKVGDKLTYVSDVSVASSNFINGTLDFAALKETILKRDRFNENTLDLALMLENITYILHSAKKDDFEVIAECLVLQRQIYSYWSALFG